MIDEVAGFLVQLEWMRSFPAKESQFLNVCKAYARFASAENVDHEYLGTVIPIEWLVNKIAGSLVFFPPPIEARRIYETFFAPLDGVEAESIERADGAAVAS